MTFRIHATTSFPTTDNQRDHARIISGLEAATAAYEAAIKEISGQDVKIDLRAKRANAPKETAALPVHSIETPQPDNALTLRPVPTMEEARDAARNPVVRQTAAE